MDKRLALDAIKVLSALESWGFSTKERLPDYLIEKLNNVVDELSKEFVRTEPPKVRCKDEK